MNMKMTRILIILLMGFNLVSGFAVGQDQIIAAAAKESEANTASSTDRAVSTLRG